MLKRHNFLTRQAIVLDCLSSPLNYEDLAILYMHGFKGCSLSNQALLDLDE